MDDDFLDVDSLLGFLVFHGNPGTGRAVGQTRLPADLYQNNAEFGFISNKGRVLNADRDVYEQAEVTPVLQ